MSTLKAGKCKLQIVGKVILSVIKNYGAVQNRTLAMTHQMQQQCWPKEYFQCSDSHESVDQCLPTGKITTTTKNKTHIYISDQIDLHVTNVWNKVFNLDACFYIFILRSQVVQCIKYIWAISISAVRLGNVRNLPKSRYCLMTITWHSCEVNFHKPLTQLCWL